MSSASELLGLLQGRGVDVIVDGSDLVLTPRDLVPANLISEIRRRKSDLLRLIDAKPINPTNRETWPEYLRRLEELSCQQFGPEGAKRQVRAELVFLDRAEGEGWMVLPRGFKGGSA